MSKISNETAHQATQELITRLRGKLTVKITEEWIKADHDRKYLEGLRAERDNLMLQREMLDLKASSEIKKLMDSIARRIQALD
ncbi:hypothetical protein [Ottowia thiooxydans]|uniref:hypothetical protein n=1 Tax=Ottowia thiooxydans TaxID=219182 RepID=UPI0003F89099|nr:hypothetical protein [Ottowia thiooxydans]